MLNEFASWLFTTLENVLDGVGPEFDEPDDGLGLIDLQCGKRVFNDVPAKMRTELWLSALQREKGKGAAAVAQYSKLSASPISQDVLAEIEKDTHRTFPGHPWLSKRAGQLSMLRVLRAYAALDPEVGYSQGMNFLAGLFLTYLDEPAAFGALTLVMQDRKLRELYKPGDGMAHLQIRLWQLGNLLSPKLAAHLEANAVLPVLYASSWLLTCFAAEFPISFAARIMDVVISDSYAAPLMKVAVKIVERCEDQLIGMDDMEEMVSLLRHDVPSWSKSKLQDLLTDALGQPWNSRQIAVLQKINGAESVADAVVRVEAAAAATKQHAHANGDRDTATTTTQQQQQQQQQQQAPATPSTQSELSPPQQHRPLPSPLKVVALPPPPSSKKDKVDWSQWTTSSPEITVVDTAVVADTAPIETILMDVPLSPTLSHALEKYSSQRNSPTKKESNNSGDDYSNGDGDSCITTNTTTNTTTTTTNNNSMISSTTPTPIAAMTMRTSPMDCIDELHEINQTTTTTHPTTTTTSIAINNNNNSSSNNTSHRSIDTNSRSSSHGSFFLSPGITSSSIPSPFESTVYDSRHNSSIIHHHHNTTSTQLSGHHDVGSNTTATVTTTAIDNSKNISSTTATTDSNNNKGQDQSFIENDFSSGFTDFIDASPGKPTTTTTTINDSTIESSADSTGLPLYQRLSTPISEQESIMQLLGKLSIDSKSQPPKEAMSQVMSHNFGSFKEAGDEYGDSAGRPVPSMESQRMSSTMASATSQALLMQHLADFSKLGGGGGGDGKGK